jgi:hypothetical protein
VLLTKEFIFHLEALPFDLKASFLIFSLESPARDPTAKGQPYSSIWGERTLSGREFLSVSVVGRLGHPDPGLPGVETVLASASTSAGRGTVPHRQVDLFLLLFLDF